MRDAGFSLGTSTVDRQNGSGEGYLGSRRPAGGSLVPSATMDDSLFHRGSGRRNKTDVPIDQGRGDASTVDDDYVLKRRVSEGVAPLERRRDAVHISLKSVRNRFVLDHDDFLRKFEERFGDGSLAALDADQTWEPERPIRYGWKSPK